MPKVSELTCIYMKVCSRVCNHKDIAPATAAGCRLWYAVVRKGGHRTIDKRHREAVEKAWLSHRYWN